MLKAVDYEIGYDYVSKACPPYMLKYAIDMNLEKNLSIIYEKV